MDDAAEARRHLHEPTTNFKCSKCLKTFPSRAECVMHLWDAHLGPIPLRDPGRPIMPPPASDVAEVETNGSARLGSD